MASAILMKIATSGGSYALICYSILTNLDIRKNILILIILEKDMTDKYRIIFGELRGGVS